MEGNDLPRVVPRPVPEGTIPLIAVEGTAYDCGRHYAEIVLGNYPGFRQYLDMASYWSNLSSDEQRLVEERAPHLLDIYRGLLEVGGPPAQAPRLPESGMCTSFGLSGSVTLDGQPISGQTKDTSVDRVRLYIALRMRIRDAPTILVLAYPGEVLGYGLWSTGTSIFRNSLHSSAGSTKGLSFEVWGLLALASESVHEAAELARKYGIRGTGNMLISDSNGESLSVETNAGGIAIIPQKEGIATHANHPEGENTRPYGAFPCKASEEDSRYRMHGLWKLLYAERGRLTPQRALMMLADHTTYPRGICKHYDENGAMTTAAVIAEPTRGKLHLVRGQACCNWPVTYTI